jgi:hydrogenase maturation protease
VHTVVLAIGNTLRGDDGVAAHVADLLGTRAGVEVRRVHQLTPELAEEMAHATAVVFVDANPGVTEARLERLVPAPQRSPLTHNVSPGELVLVAEQLYGFQGAAYLCHVPAENFAEGDSLSEVAKAGARAAAQCVLALLVDGMDDDRKAARRGKI